MTPVKESNNKFFVMGLCQNVILDLYNNHFQIPQLLYAP